VGCDADSCVGTGLDGAPELVLPKRLCSCRRTELLRGEASSAEEPGVSDALHEGVVGVGGTQITCTAGRPQLV